VSRAGQEVIVKAGNIHFGGTTEYIQDARGYNNKNKKKRMRVKASRRHTSEAEVLH